MRTPLALSLLLSLVACKGGKEETEPTDTTTPPTVTDTDTDTTDTDTTDTDTTPTPGDTLSPMEFATHPDAAWMSVAGANGTVWIVGAQTTANLPPVVLRSENGGPFEALETPTLHDIWWVHAFDDGVTFLGGGGQTILRHENGAFTRMATPGFAGHTVYGMWGASSDDVWAVGGFAGRDGFLWHFDGTAWSEVDLPMDIPMGLDGEVPSIFKAWGRSSDDVYFVGGAGLVLHWDGASLTTVDAGTDEQLFTVSGNDTEITIVGGGTAGLVLRGDRSGFTDITPPGAPLLQGLHVVGEQTFYSGANGFAAREVDGTFEVLELGLSETPASLHAVWFDGTDLWAVGGGVLTPALDAGVAASTAIVPAWAPEAVVPPDTSCPADRIDIVPDGSIARRWNELLLDSIRRDIPDPPKHARNLYTHAVALYDTWSAYQTVSDGVVYTDRHVGTEDDVETAISYAAYRVLTHRYAAANGAATSLDCYDGFMDVLGLDPTDTHTDGDDPIAVGNRVAEEVLTWFETDGANELNGYVDTTGWKPTNAPLIIDLPGNPSLTEPNVWQQLNLATAETQNGIVLETSVQPYIGTHWREVRGFAIERDPVTGLYADYFDQPAPTIEDPEMIDWAMEVIRKTSELDHQDGVMIDISPGAINNNPVGTNDGTGHPVNPATGLPYEPNIVPRGDFTRVVAEMWADGPTSETPPGHWTKLANEVSDALDPSELRPYGQAQPVDRLAWDVGIYLVVNGATHDAAITAWELKRDSLGPRPVSIIRWMADKGQRTDPTLPSYDPMGLELEDGVVELITEESAAPGERHHHLRYHVGELAVWSWPGEPGDRSEGTTSFQWMRARDWIPYQRRTFVTPAFPGFTSGHSNFSRAAAEALTAYTADPYFPGGLGEFVAPEHGYLVFESGPSVELHLQWATYRDAADQAGQSRLWGGIHLWPDDRIGRLNGEWVGMAASDLARDHWRGAVR